jgi:N-acetylglutamate synthase
LNDSPDAQRLEELSLNSSAPPGQLLYDGWLLRMAPGKAKRARSVNAVYESSRPLAEKISYCERLYARARLPALFRMTPFSQPPGLDAELARRGYGRFDETAVECAAIGDRGAGSAQAMSLGRWIDAVGDLRGSPAEHRAGHRARLEGLPLAMRAVAVERGGEVVATGLAIVEDDCAGLFDIVTAEQARRQGHARDVVASLLAAARELGARHAYLQVQRDNEAARRLYREFGFEERYMYWYRARPGERK